jgi:hypothetical protein
MKLTTGIRKRFRVSNKGIREKGQYVLKKEGKKK